VIPEHVNAAFASYLIRYQLRLNMVNPSWVSLVTSVPAWRRRIESMAASSAGQYNLNLRVIGSLPIPLPPLPEQEHLLERVFEQRGQVERLRVELETAAARAGSLRRSLLVAAFSGRLVSQDPIDEPAELLLKRIQAERTAAAPRTRRTRKAGVAQ
jgi:type I restriction enzyme S subunit